MPCITLTDQNKYYMIFLAAGLIFILSLTASMIIDGTVVSFCIWVYHKLVIELPRKIRTLILKKKTV